MDVSKTSSGRKQDLRARTKLFAAMTIRLYCILPNQRTEVQVIGKQLLRSGTSIAANYREASRARSRRDFVSKIETCSQEADETILWLELLQEECGIVSEMIPYLLREANELIAIFVTMAIKTKANYI